MTEENKSANIKTCYEYGTFWLAEYLKYLEHSRLTEDMRISVLKSIEDAKEYIEQGNRSYEEYSQVRGIKEKEAVAKSRAAARAQNHKKKAFLELKAEHRLAVSTLIQAKRTNQAGIDMVIFHYRKIRHLRVRPFLRPRYFLPYS